MPIYSGKDRMNILIFSKKNIKIINAKAAKVSVPLSHTINPRQNPGIIPGARGDPVPA